MKSLFIFFLALAAVGAGMVLVAGALVLKEMVMLGAGSGFPYIWIAVGGIGVICVAAPLAVLSKPKRRLHEVIYQQVWGKDRSQLTEVEKVCFDAQSLHLYLTAGGLDRGIGNMGEEEVRKALPSLTVLGMKDTAQEILAFLEIYEAMVGIQQMDQQTTDEYFETAKQVYQRVAYGLHEIPDRLDAYLAKAM